MDSYLLLEVLGTDYLTARKQFIRFTGLPNDDSFADYEQERPDEERTKRDVERLLRDKYDLGLPDVNSIDYDRRCAIIATVRASLSLTYEKLGQILDVSKDAVFRACQRQLGSRD